VNAILIFGPGSTSTVAESRLSPGLSATGRKLLRHVLFPTQLFRADAVRTISGFHIVSAMNFLACRNVLARGTLAPSRRVSATPVSFA
jgi:hypothetical protein